MKFFVLTLTGLLLGFFLSGCGDSASKTAAFSEPASSLSSPEGMVRYLRSLPSVQEIETWDNPYGPGLEIRTRHYRVFTTLMEPLMLRQLPFFLESAFEAYSRQVPDPVSADRPFTTYLFGQRSEWEAFTRDFTGEQAEMYLRIQRGAYVLNDVCAAYYIGRTQTFAVLGHEGWHQFNSRFFSFRIPSWLDEGIATLFESSRFERNRFVFEPQNNLNRLGSLKLTMDNGRMIPLRDLIVLNPGQVLPGLNGGEENVTAFYAQTYAFVRFLREENYGARLKSYHNLLLAGLRGNWPLDEAQRRVAADRSLPLTVAWNAQVSPRLFSMYIDPDIEKIDREYQNYCSRKVYHIRVRTREDAAR